jgi:hypothetical protein
VKGKDVQTLKGFRGGFKAEREFGFSIPAKFPNLEMTADSMDGAVLVVNIDNPRSLNLYQLAKVLIGAANGGIKTAVVVKGGLVKAMPISLLWLMVDEGQELNAQFKLESAIRTGV